MSNTMRFFLTLALLSPAGLGNAQVYFNRQIDWEHDYEYHKGISVFDSAQYALLAGGNLKLTPLGITFLITKMSTAGDVLWSKSFQPRPGAFGNTASMVKINEEYSLIHGNVEVSDSENQYKYHFFIIKIRNDTGDTLWSKEIGNSLVEESGLRIIATADGGFALSGYFAPVGNAQPLRLLLLKIDSLGNQVFRKEYTSDAGKDHQDFSLVQTSDGGYLILAYRSYYGPYPGGLGNENKIDLVLLKTNAQGTQQWIKVYEPTDQKQILLYGTDIQPLPDGNFLVSGLKSYAAYLPGYSYYGKYLWLKFNPQGAIIDSVSLPGNYYYFKISRLKPAGDGNFWAIGAEQDSATTGQTGLIMKISPNLQVLWKREYRVSPPESLIHDIFYEGALMPDKGFILCGRAFGPLEDSTNQNAWVIRVDSFGCLEPGCDSTVAVQEPTQTGEVGLQLSPNPTAGELRLLLTDPEAVLLGARLLDMQGRVIQDIQFLRSAGWRACVLNLAEQPAGVYVVQVRTSQGWAVRKVVRD